MLSKKAKQDIVYTVLAILIVFGLYMGSQLISLYNSPSEYNIARNGRIINYEQDIAYVIREEEVLDTSECEDHELQIIISDNNRAAKGSAIASYTLEDCTEQKEEIKEIDKQIQELIKTVQIEYSQDLKAIEKNLETEVYNFSNYKNDIEAMSTRKKTIEELLEKKVKIISGFSEKGSDLEKLIKEREKIEKEINKNKNNIKATRAGLVSYRVDGYEDTFVPDNFSKITTKMLDDVKYSTDQLIPIDNRKIKIVNNFYSYLIIVSKSDESKRLMPNDVVKFTINNNLSNLSKGIVEYIINEDNTRYIFIKTTDNVEKLAQYRKLTINVVWWNYQGLKISDDSIFDDEVINNQGEVVKLKAINIQSNIGYIKKAWVKVEKQAGGNSIIDNYTDQELLDLGLSESAVENRNKLNLYDKVLVNKK